MKKIYLLLFLVCLSIAGYSQCTPGFNYPAYACSSYGMTIQSLRIVGYSGSTLSDASACTGAGYLYRTSDTIRMQQGNTYSVTMGTTTSYTMNAQIWIDFNNNLTWEASESVGGLNRFSTSGTFNVTIPATAATGPHRMRVLTVCTIGSSASYPSINPCAPGYDYGEVRDYTAIIIPLPACSGSVTAGSASASDSVACSTTSISLSLRGATSASGMTYQWQSSTDSVTWTNISGATTIPYNFSGFSASRYYRCYITCTSSGSTDTSRLTYIRYSVCYCTPSYTSASASCTTYNMTIIAVNMAGYGGTWLGDSAACDGSGYLNRTSLSCDLQQSIAYTFNTTTGATYNVNGQAWIDFNDNGTFEATETVGGRNNYRAGSNFTLTVPLTATPGRHRMRYIVSYAPSGYTYPSMDPCTSGYTYGEGRDYYVNIIALPACTGAPTAGRAIADVNPACPSDTFYLNLSGATAASSLVYQWQSSSDSVTWTNISGATTLPYRIIGMSTSTYYRCYVRCTATGGGTDTSTKVRVISTACYCRPTYSSASAACSTYNMYIVSFAANGYGGTTLRDNAACTGTGYQLRSGLSVDFQQSITYTLTIATGPTYQMNCQTWIDFNDNGTFETTESVGGLNGFVSTGNTYNITIPLTATVGRHRMRVVTSYAPSGFSYPTMNPCGSYTYGETRDYYVNIIALPPCSGTPTAGTAVADYTMVCSTDTVTLSIVGATSASGLTYQWQSSTDSSTWTNISGATTYPYQIRGGITTTTYYRCTVTCSTGGSTVITVPVRLISVPCYCRPSYSNAGLSCTSYQMTIKQFFADGYGGTTLRDTARCNGSGYLNRLGLSVDFQQSITYTLTIGTGPTYQINCQTWIDFNNNGTFESTESVGGLNNYSSLGNTYNITIPLTAPVGAHRMRVVTSYAPSGYTYPTMSPCPSYTYGETRDYTVNIITLPPCSGTPNGGITVADLNPACSTDVQILSLSGATSASSLVYQWQRSSDSTTWTDIAGATTIPYSFTGMTAPTYYRCIVTCTLSTSSAVSRRVYVAFTPCYCVPSFTSTSTCSVGGIDTFAVNGFAGSRLFDNRGCSGSGYSRRTSLSVDLMQSFSYGTTVSSVSAFYNVSCQVWIDFNDNGTFESSESVGGSGTYRATTTFSIAIPFTATPGLHRMRVINVYNSYGGATYPSINPCAGYTYGDARDYTANILLLPPCSGTPTAGVAHVRYTVACPTDVNILSLTGTTVATGLAYQWQSSTDTTTWTDISGATDAVSSVTGMTGPTYYRCLVTCTRTSSAPGISSWVYVGTSPCFCIPHYTADSLACASYRMGVVAFDIDGESSTYIHDSIPCDGTGYAIHLSMMCDLMQGTSYTTTIASGTTFNMNCQVWIDFNDNGTFEASESVGGMNNYSRSGTFTTTIPTGAALGTHRMRLVTSNASSGFVYPSLDPCTTSYVLGEARDYLVTIMTNICSGTPTAGSISPSSYAACASTSASLRVTGFTSGRTVTLQWQTSTDSTTWTDISGATTNTYSTGTITSSTYYRVAVTCTVSTRTSYTVPVRIRINPNPTAISTGGAYLCEGYSILLSCTPSGGTWSSSDVTRATITSTTGIMSGVASGTVNITYTLSTGCYTTRSITVNSSPLPISGTTPICVFGTTTLTSGTSGGAWSSSNPSIGTISTGGTVTALGYGTVNITYTNTTTGCFRTYPVTINPLPGAIIGSSALCTGTTTNFSNSVGGGTWVSSNPSVATINPSTGAALALSTGSVTITYTLSTGCYQTLRATVNPAVPAITGTTSLCEGNTATLRNAAGGGTWTVSDTFLARIGATTGGVTGLAAGTVVVTYSLSTGCTDTALLQVNATPTPLSGTNSVCIGDNISFTTTPSGGTWTTASSAVATVTGSTSGTSSIGRITGMSAVDSTVITYTTSAGCSRSRMVRVDSFTNLYYGTASMCTGTTLRLSDSASRRGVWSSLRTSIAVVDSITGLVTAISSGVDSVYFTNIFGCRSNTLLTVNPTPGTIGGPTQVCVGNTITLTDATTGGNWFSSNTSIATINASGILTGVSAGTVAISYRMPTGCFETVNVTVNANPDSITGPTRVCEGANITLSNTTIGGSWSSTSSNVLVNATTGLVNGLTPGTAIINYTIPSTGCFVSRNDTVNAVPASLTGSTSLCEGGFASTLSSSTGGGMWSSRNTAVATTSGSGIITSAAAGTTTISYTMPTGCFTTANFTVNPNPAAIAGTRSICVGNSTTLTDATAGGLWTSTSSAVSIGASSGTLIAASAGTTTISYTLAGTGCFATTTFTVNALPTAITPSSAAVCAGGSTVTFSDTTTGGVWSTSAAGVATATSTSGVITGVASGTTTVSYTVSSTGCFTTATINVIALPSAITGASNVCLGSTTTLADATPGGSWSTASTARATITAGGTVTGVSVGTTMVSYTSSVTGCSAVTPFTVNPLPAPIAGPAAVCSLQSVTLTDTSSGGSWSSASSAISVAGSTGVVMGSSVGTGTVTYTLPTGCMATRAITVNALPAPITGTANVCAGYTVVLSDSTAGGAWSSSSTSVATVNSSGVVRGVSAGTATITYTNPSTSCFVTRTHTVNGVVTPTIALTASPSLSICSGSTITFTTSTTNAGSTPTYSWSVNGTTVASGSSYTYAPTDGDIVRVRVLSSALCAIPDTATATNTVRVFPNVTPGVTMSTGVGDTVCARDTVTFTATPVGGGSAPTFRWSVNGVPVSSTTNTYRYVPMNGDVVRCVVVSNSPCHTGDSAFVTKIMTVSPTLTPSVAINSTGGTFICVGTEVTFTAVPTNGGTAPTYVWSVNGTVRGSGSTFIYTPANADVVQVVMTSNFPCVTSTTATNTMTMAVNPVAYPVGRITATPGTRVTTGTNVTFTAVITSGGGSAPAYQWFINGLPISGATNVTYSTTSYATGDSICCIVTNTDPCSGSTTLNCLGMTIGFPEGITTIQNTTSFNVFPNPNTGTFTIKGGIAGNVSEDLNITISDMVGKVIFSTVIHAHNGEINQTINLPGTLANGMYLLNVKSEHVAATYHFAIEQ